MFQKLWPLFFLLAVGYHYKAKADCLYGDQVVKVGNAIGIFDPVLYEQAKRFYLDSGYSEQESIELAGSDDWTHIVLSCVQTYRKSDTTGSNTRPAANIDLGPQMLVAVEHQADWLMSLKNYRF